MSSKKTTQRGALLLRSSDGGMFTSPSQQDKLRVEPSADVRLYGRKRTGAQVDGGMLFDLNSFFCLLHRLS